MKNKEKIIVGVSGGSDSMYLLNKIIKENKFVPIVAHINYHIRKESDIDQKIVEDYCKENNIDFYIKNITSQDWEDVKHLKNKQSMAREQRYQFYIDVAKQNNVKDIYLAHHLDDWLETAIMQKQRSTDYLFFGIKELSLFKGFNINRPLLNMFKDQILTELKKNKVKYVTDKTNFEPIYERNKIRLELKNLSKDEKKVLIAGFEKLNESKKELNKQINIVYDNFIQSDYSWDFFKSISEEYKKYVIYYFLINSKYRVNISSEKLKAILIFLKNKNGNKEFRLMENIFLKIKNNQIIIFYKEVN